MMNIDIGGTATDESAAPEFVPVYVQAGGAGTTVLVLSGDTVNYYTSIDAPPAGSLTATQSATFTINPVWLTSNSISSVQLTGPGY